MKMSDIISPDYRKALLTQTPMSAFPKEGGYHTYTAEGTPAKVNAMYQAFLDEMQSTREGFELLSTNVVPYFNGIGLYATYKFDRTRKLYEIKGIELD